MPCCCKNEHRVAGMSRRQFKTLFSIALVDMELRDFQSKLVIHLHASASLPTVLGGFLLRGRRRAASRPQDLHDPYYVTRGHIGVAEGKEALKPVGDQPLPLASGPQTKVDHLHWTFLEGLQRGTNKGEFGQNELANAAIRRKRVICLYVKSTRYQSLRLLENATQGTVIHKCNSEKCTHREENFLTPEFALAVNISSSGLVNVGESTFEQRAMQSDFHLRILANIAEGSGQTASSFSSSQSLHCQEGRWVGSFCDERSAASSRLNSRFSSQWVCECVCTLSS